MIKKQVKGDNYPTQINSSAQKVLKPGVSSTLTSNVSTAKIKPVQQVQSKNKPQDTSSTASKTVLNQKQMPTPSNIKIQDNKQQQESIVKTINIEFKKTLQHKKAMSELESILKINGKKITLSIDSKFDSDKDSLNLSQTLISIAHNIYYLNWTIQGKITDLVAKQITDALGKFTNAFRIDLKILTRQFSEKGSNLLALALKKLQKLHILNIYLQHQTSGASLQMDFDELYTIGQSISTLQSLEHAFYSRLQDYTYPLNQKISNQIYVFENECYNNSKKIKKLMTDFTSKIDGMKNKLTSLFIKNNDFLVEEGQAKECDCCDDDTIDLRSYLNAVTSIIKYCINLPYLTYFEDQMSIYSYEVKGFEIVIDKSDYKYKAHKALITNITNQKLINIMQIIAFNMIAFDSIAINPIMVLSDLSIE